MQAGFPVYVMKLWKHRRDDGFPIGGPLVKIVQILIPISRGQPFAAMHWRPAEGTGAGKSGGEMRQGVGGRCRLQSIR